MVHTPPDNLAINLSHVEKTFKGKVRALRGIDMQVHRGEIFGLLGPNGAGKSTLVKILLTIVRPTRCHGTMLGAPVGHKPALAQVGYLPEHLRFPDYLTGAQALDYFGALAGTPRRERRRRADELLGLVGMTDWASKKIKGYSKGMKQRMGLAQALINEPDLVFLDEPTDGVDPVGRRDIRNLILRLKDQGKTVFINSHLLSELEMVCDRVAILVQGVVAQQGTINDLTLDQQRYEIEVAPVDERTLREAAGAAPSATPQIEITADRAVLRIPNADAERIQPVIDALRSRAVIIRAVRSVRPSLEDLFMRAVTDPTTGDILPPGAEPAPKRARRGRPADPRRAGTTR